MTAPDTAAEITSGELQRLLRERLGVRSGATRARWVAKGWLPAPRRLATGRLVYPRNQALAAIERLAAPEHVAERVEAMRKLGRHVAAVRRRLEVA